MALFRSSEVDAPSASALLTEYFASRAAGFPGGPEAYRVVVPDPGRFVPPHGVFLLAEGEDLSGEPADVGCGGIRRLSEGRYEVKHLYVQPHVRGLGIGRALLIELEDRAISFGATELVLDTNASLLAAGSLYRSLGYRDIEPYNDNPNATTWLGKRLG